MTPIKDRIVVQRLEEVTSGIVIPLAVEGSIHRATVISVSPTLRTEVKPGDVVFFGPKAGKPMNIDGVEYLLMREDEVAAISEAQV